MTRTLLLGLALLIPAAASAGIPEDIAGLQSADAAVRGRAEARLLAAGWEAARALAAEAEGGEAFEAAKTRVLAPFRARLFLESSAARPEDVLFGTLTGGAFVLGKEAGRASQTVTPRADGGWSLRTSIDLDYQDYVAKFVATSEYDGQLQMLSTRIAGSGKNRGDGQSMNLDQDWVRLDKGLTPTQATFKVTDENGERVREVTLPRGTVLPDLLIALGRLMDYGSKRRQLLELQLLNPDALRAFDGKVESVRREKVVVKGGDRGDGLRLVASSSELPAEFSELKAWLDPNHIPLKARIGPFTTYAEARFEKAAPKAEAAPKEGAGEEPKPAPKDDPEGPRKFF